MPRPVSKTLSNKPYEEKDSIVAINRELLPVMREARRVINAVLGVTVVAEDYSVLDSDGTVVFDSASAVDCTLPSAVERKGAIFTIKNRGAGVVSMLTVLSQTIDASASGALTLAQWAKTTVQSDGENWLTI